MNPEPLTSDVEVCDMCRKAAKLKPAAYVHGLPVGLVCDTCCPQAGPLLQWLNIAGHRITDGGIPFQSQRNPDSGFDKKTTMNYTPETDAVLASFADLNDTSFFGLVKALDRLTDLCKKLEFERDRFKANADRSHALYMAERAKTRSLTLGVGLSGANE